MSALPSAPNSLSINQIAQEFGGDTPHAISEYYAGGDNVPAGTQVRVVAYHLLVVQYPLVISLVQDNE